MTTLGKRVGTVVHYYNRLGVGIIRLDEDLKTGVVIRFQGHNTDFQQPLSEMQFDHKPIDLGRRGQEN